MKRRVLIAALPFLHARGSASEAISKAFSATYKNDSTALSRALKGGVNPNSKNEEGESLLYVATGPKGGMAVIQMLLGAGADPNVGHGKYTPLMNAASWANLEAVDALLKAGANPKLINESGQTAIQVVGLAGGAERAVIERLQRATAATPNPSIERTSPGKPGAASHVKR